jgi:hypothetical protein
LGGSLGLSCRLGGAPPVLEPGSCPPSEVDFPNKATWEAQLAACGVAGTGCDGGGVCVPKPSDDNESVCIRQEGSVSCPAGFTQTLQAFTGGRDTRGCNACTCGDAGTTCAGGSYTFFDLDGCVVADPSVVVDANTCVDVTPTMDTGTWSVQATLPAAAGGCAAQGGEPIGAVQPDGPVTFCCR